NRESQKLITELKHIIERAKYGEFTILKEHEDCHTAIENHLTKTLGDVGKKIHTARSRNDQVLAALRLYYKEELHNCRILINELDKAITHFVKTYGNIKFPGYTHTRKAMPSSISMWGNSFIDSMEDNKKVLDIVLELIDQSPLGACAGYGVPLTIDKDYTANLLGFKKVQENPIYTQNSRGKFESTILHACSQIMLDLNKIATDLIIFSMPEFGYFEIPKEFCTGSSIMPHKKNPDVLELVRAKYHVVVSYEFQIKSVIGNHLSGYNRDLQLLKEPIIKAFEITKDSLSVTSLVFSELKVSKENCKKAMTQDLYAAEKVYELVKQGIPFRKAYQIIAKKYN
ncbi:lyase family protein, partial [Patescibacteria group bacterium AH-259-L07]|nr:lyase family protein [Patescibacteria group bacterium AH-259-L07]